MTLPASPDVVIAVQSPGNSNPGGTFRYDPTLGGTGEYHFSLKATGLARDSYLLYFTAGDDPLLHTIGFIVR